MILIGLMFSSPISVIILQSPPHRSTLNALSPLFAFFIPARGAVLLTVQMIVNLLNVLYDFIEPLVGRL